MLQSDVKKNIFYQKYRKYKKKYLITSQNGGVKKTEQGVKPKYPKLESLKSEISLSFISNAVKNDLHIKSLPQAHKLPFKAYLGAPSKMSSFESEMKDVIVYLKKGYFVNLTLQVSKECDKHAVLLYFDEELNRIELWDSNGYCHGVNTFSYLESVLGYVRDNIKEGETIDYIVSEGDELNINRIGDGHCDALTLFYVVLRNQSYEYGQNIYQILWTDKTDLGKKNMLLLNDYLKKKDITSLMNLARFNNLEEIEKYFTPLKKSTQSALKIKSNITKKNK